MGRRIGIGAVMVMSGVIVAVVVLYRYGGGKGTQEQPEPQARQEQEPRGRETPQVVEKPAGPGPRAEPGRPEPVEPAAAETPEADSGCRTVPADKRDVYNLYLCSQCGKSFSPTPESVRKQANEKGGLIDCPLCKGTSCADPAVCCGNCKTVFPSQGTLAVACPTCRCTYVPPGKVAICCPKCMFPFVYPKGQPAICPKCKTDAAQWRPGNRAPR